MAKRPTKRQIRKTFNFVLSELVRYSEISTNITKLRQLITEEGWTYDIPFPDNRRRLIGKAAHDELAALSRAIVASDERLVGKVKINPFFQLLSEELGRVIWERKEIDERDFVEDCIRKTLSIHLKPREFYIPCIAPSIKGVTTFKIGPVTFIKKEYFLKNDAKRIRTDNSLKVDELKSFYQVQNWVAHVRIDGFDEKSSEDRAFLIVRLAIASIKSRLEREHAQWLGNEKQSMPGLLRYSLTSEPSGEDPSKICLGWRRQFIATGTDEEVVVRLLGESSRSWFLLFGAFLNKAMNLGQWSYLESKIVTAMIWLDLGNSQISDAERIVAFSNCLESIFVTKEQGKKQQLAKRSRLLLEYSGWRPELNGKVAEFYSRRSEIVHGDKMPVDPEFRNAAFIGKYLTDVCIEGFIHFSNWLLIKHQQAGTREHDLPFNGHGSFDRAMEDELPLFIEEMKMRTNYKP
ncbi:HEPN domain-containing protein [Ruegeria sp. HKCCE3926]|uniref:HEPN domain-containing protein n=1 Tax=Ruegeria sp. HKCCE3926 TaxID=2794831 RepID=UPI001AE6D272|nr:HEPN domain-containing protein [Ruegeria sp. HKCCE3926]